MNNIYLKLTVCESTFKIVFTHGFSVPCLEFMLCRLGFGLE